MSSALSARPGVAFPTHVTLPYLMMALEQLSADLLG